MPREGQPYPSTTPLSSAVYTSPGAVVTVVAPSAAKNAWYTGVTRSLRPVRSALATGLLE
jgi:hypothetical protein